MHPMRGIELETITQGSYDKKYSFSFFKYVSESPIFLYHFETHHTDEMTYRFQMRSKFKPLDSKPGQLDE
jgi:hypothetical protein